MIKKLYGYAIALLLCAINTPLYGELSNCVGRCLVLKNQSGERVTVFIDTQPDTSAPTSITAIPLSLKSFYIPVNESKLVEVPEDSNIFMIYWQFEQKGRTYKVPVITQPDYAAGSSNAAKRPFFIVLPEKSGSIGKAPFQSNFIDQTQGTQHDRSIQSESNNRLLGS